MKHRIDDIFQKGLKNQEHPFQETDWTGAQAMLGFPKRKRRIPIWIFLLGGMTLVLLMSLLYFSNESTISAFSNDAFANVENMNLTGSDATSSQTSSSQTSSSQLNSDESSSDELATNIQELAGTKNNTVKENDNQEIAESAISSGSSSENNSRLPIVPSNYNSNSISKVSSASSDEIVKYQTPNKASTPSNQIIIAENKTSVKVSSISVLPDAPLNDNSTLQSINSESKEDSNLGLLTLSKLIYLPTLQLKKFVINPVFPKSPKTTMIEAQVESLPWQFGIYAGLILPDVSWSLGGFTAIPITSSLSINVGAGLQWRELKNAALNTELELFNQSGALQASDFSEDIQIKRLALEIPLNIEYRKQKHIFHLGILTSKTLWSLTSYNSVVSPSMDILDVPAPGFDLAADPISFRQKVTMNNVEELKKIDFNIMLGYGYQLSNKLSLHASGLYKMTENIQVPSVLIPNQKLDFYTSRWQLRTTVKWHF